MTTEIKPIPSYLLTPEDWAQDALRRANDYTGMIEGTWFLVEARRYLALNDRIKELESKVNGQAG